MQIIEGGGGGERAECGELSQGRRGGRGLNIPLSDGKERERERRFRSYFLRGATPSIGKADGGKKVRGGAAFACHVP